MSMMSVSMSMSASSHCASSHNNNNNKNNNRPLHDSTATATASSSSSSRTDSAPLYITVGPPCCGKTTWLKQKQHQQQQQDDESHSLLQDITLDDQPNVYVPIPTELFCFSSEEMMKMNNGADNNSGILAKSMYAKSVYQRLLSDDQRELRLVLQRLSGKISTKELEESLRLLLVPNDTSTANNVHDPLPQQQQQPSIPNQSEIENEVLLATLLESVKSVLEENESNLSLPESVDLFVVEALFQKDPELNSNNSASQNNNWTAIERATNMLRQTSRTTSVCWGNTNTKPRDYSAVLEIAQQHHRPVHFCIFGVEVDHGASSSSCAPPSSSSSSLLLFDLPHVGYRELMNRNLQRLLKTGRYIPSKVVADFSKRTENLINDALNHIRSSQRDSSTTNEGNESQSYYVPTKFDLDRQLARMAQFDMKNDRTVTKCTQRNGGDHYLRHNNNINKNQNGNQHHQNQYQRHGNDNQRHYNRTSQPGQSSWCSPGRGDMSSWRSNNRDGGRGRGPPRHHQQQSYSHQQSQYQPYPAPSRARHSSVPSRENRHHQPNYTPNFDSGGHRPRGGNSNQGRDHAGDQRGGRGYVGNHRGKGAGRWTEDRHDGGHHSSDPSARASTNSNSTSNVRSTR